HHVAFTFDDANNTQTLYLDGVALITNSYTTSIDYTAATTTYLGSHNSSSTYDMQGMIDDARIYTRALSVDEVAALSAGQTTGSTTVSITAVNDEPTLTATGSDPTFTEGDSAVGLFSGAAVSTVESGQTITGLTFTVTNVTDTGNEQITIDGATITLDDLESGSTTDFSYSVSLSGTTATVTLSGGTASTANVVGDIDNATYINNSQDPTDANRVITITAVVDSGGTANGGDDAGTPVALSTVNVNPVNDAIDMTVTGNTVLFTEDAGATTSLFSSTIDTIETTDTITQVVLTMANVESGDTLTFGATNIDLNTNGATGPDGNGFSYTVSSAGVSPVVTITHAGTDDGTVNTMLNSLVFNNTTNNDPGTTARTVTLTSITDSGSGLTADGTIATVNVAKADDAIGMTVTGNTVLFTEDAGATTSLSSSSIDTIETTDTITEVVLTMANVESG
ncbi:MAG: LamG domain-containing protein, partial [Aestuariibacter sp.]|nr:LamG domain-containing protein [Aestuariibacter sp.]